MKIIRVNNEDYAISEPVYLDPASIAFRDDAKIVSGTCFFPMTDISVADRHDHVNMTHLFHVMWNCAALMRRRGGWAQTLATSVDGRAFKIVPPDEPVQFEFLYSIFRRLKQTSYGRAQTTFSHRGEVAARIGCQFMARPDSVSDLSSIRGV